MSNPEQPQLVAEVGTVMLEDFSNTLLPALTDRKFPLHVLHRNLGRIVESDTSHLIVTKLGRRHICSTATLNDCPVLSGDGFDPWIDDVVTAPAYQGMGYSSAIMDFCRKPGECPGSTGKFNLSPA